jgi:hypothetical protein
MHEVFNDRDAKELLSHDASNEIIWKYDKKGMYWVKSAYRVCVDIMIDRNEWKVDGGWNKLRGLAIPPKVKHFMWRLGRDCLPNRQRLSSKGVDCQENCVVCQTYTEYNWHIFLCCNDSISCWRQQNLWVHLELKVLKAGSLKVLSLNILHCSNETRLITFAMSA